MNQKASYKITSFKFRGLSSKPRHNFLADEFAQSQM